MIGRVYRGSRTVGLLRYLYGPGRHNEHVDPHLVAAWDGGDEAALLALEPRVDGDGYDVTGLAAELDAPLAYAERRTDRFVWHCPLRVAEGDRPLTDAEWREVAEDVLHRTGIAPRGVDGGCRWVAVRHDEVSIHLVAVLARQDGRPVRLWRDYHRVREACLAAEQRYGLRVTAAIDGAGVPRPSRAESEKAARGGRREEPRVRLRREVRRAAVGAESLEDFFGRVRRAGLLVRERVGESGELTGYAVAVPGDTTAAGQPVWYGGGRLAPDLTLPRLLERWQTPWDGGFSHPLTADEAERRLPDVLVLLGRRAPTGLLHLEGSLRRPRGLSRSIRVGERLAPAETAALLSAVAGLARALAERGDQRQRRLGHALRLSVPSATAAPTPLVSLAAHRVLPSDGPGPQR